MVLIILAADHFGCSYVLKCKIDSCSIKPCPCKPDCSKDCWKSVNDLLESIALMETSLSHILNAEGEKLQKAVCIAENVCELIEIDNAVNKTITNVTFLEQTLYAKLEALTCFDLRKCCGENDDCN